MCLKDYLDTSRNMSQLTMPDLNNVLNGLQGSLFGVKSTPSEKENDERWNVGEHVIVFWVEGENTPVWYLSVVESVSDDGIFVSVLTPCNKAKFNWVYPEEAQVYKIDYDQIVMKNIAATYHKSVRIRCSLSSDTMKQIETAMRNLL